LVATQGLRLIIVGENARVENRASSDFSLIGVSQNCRLDVNIRVTADTTLNYAVTHQILTSNLFFVVIINQGFGSSRILFASASSSV